MKHLILVTASALFILPGAYLGLNQTGNKSVSAQKTEQVVNNQTRKATSSRVRREIVKGAESPDEIPDLVAYELFFRTIAGGHARGLIEKIGLNDEARGILSEAKNLDDIFSGLDGRAFELKSDKKDSRRLDTQTEIQKLQSKKDEIVAMTVDRYLPNTLGKTGAMKLREYINTVIKSHIQRVQTIDVPDQNGEPSGNAVGGQISTFGSPFGNVYLYSDGWQDGANAYGSGAIIEQYASSVSYQITVKITSTGGRANSSASDWTYAPFSHDVGLSIGSEDGNYAVQVDFTEQNGYYDEYGNFYGSGGSYIGTSSSIAYVAPTVVLIGAFVTPDQFYIGGNPPTVNGTGTVSASITATQSVPENTTVEFDFFETVNPGVSYTVTAGQSTGYQPYPVGNRQIRREVTRSGQLETLNGLFTVNVGNSTSTGTVTNQLKINRIIASLTPTPNNGGVAGENAQVAANFTLSPAPTPRPSPSPGGGGCGGGLARSSGSPDKSIAPSNCSPCNPDPQEVLACQQFGGVYDWSACFCGQSPIILDILGNGFKFTGPSDGVFFDILANQQAKRLSWTAPDSDDAWLALDRNQNGQIDNGAELFGNVSEQPAGQSPRHGFATLGMFDSPTRGGNGDGTITRSDPIYRKLRLWVDRNHNGRSEPEELYRLNELDVIAISLDYKESNFVDRFGNRFKYRAKVRDRENARVGRWAWDVFLRTAR